MTSYPRIALRTQRAVQRDIRRLLEQLRRDAAVGLHLGCAGKKLPGMINCDKFDPAADLPLDAADLGRFGVGTVDLIECHHMIEHLSFGDAERAVAEWSRVLKGGGLLVISCPDLDRVMQLWVGRSGEGGDYVLKMIYGSQEHEGMFHRSGYNRRRLAALLARHGIAVEFAYTPYPDRPTPSLLVIGRRRA
jgi:SAM-dependent methyltransferase